MAGKDQVSPQQAVIRHAQDDMANLPPERAQVPEQQPEKASGIGPPSTASVLWAEWRRGLKDLQNFVLNPWQGQVAQHEEPGTIANPTNVEVYQDRRAQAADNDSHSYEQTLAESAQRAQYQPPQEQERGRSR